MRTGLGTLGMAPSHFWCLTPREFDAAVRGHLDLPEGGDVPARLDLDLLLARFPDIPHAP